MEHIIREYPETDLDSDPNHWCVKWLKFSCSLPGIMSPPQYDERDEEGSTKRRLEWVDEVADSFCSHLKSMDLFRARWLTSGRGMPRGGRQQPTDTTSSATRSARRSWLRCHLATRKGSAWAPCRLAEGTAMRFFKGATAFLQETTYMAEPAAISMPAFSAGKD